MSLRNQPYLPLYINDFITDEKLIECSAESTGVYIRLLCLMHKSETYGTILLKQKHKQSENQIENFATCVVKNLPYTFNVVLRSLTELVEEKVLEIHGDSLIQKRMVKDNKLSEIRSLAGKKGGRNSQNKEDKTNNFVKAKTQANTVIENEYENEDVIENKIDIENEVFDLKIQNPKKSEIEYEIEILVEVYKNVTGRKFKAIDTIIKNYTHWRLTYSPKEIEQAITNIPKDKFWSDKMTPIILFRQRNPNGENVDYIGGLLEYSKSSNENQKSNAMNATAQYLESLY